MKSYSKFSLLLIYGLPIPLLFGSLLVGSSQQFGVLDFLSAFLAWFSSSEPSSWQEQQNIAMMQNIMLNIRMPRILLTFMVGAALACSGNALQALFRNPLVDSYVLGISSGAAFGAGLALLIPWIPVQFSAFLFGLFAVALTYAFAYQRYEKSNVVMVLLSGMIVSGLCIAGLSIVQYLSDPYKLQAILQWTMGNLHQATWQKVQHASLPIVSALLGLYLLRWRMNVLALGQLEAQEVGVQPQKDQFWLVMCVTLATSSSVAVAGMISLYGLFLPHIVRMLIGSNNVQTTPATICFGGSFLLFIDTLSRSLLSFEIPIGIFTMFIGAPLFLYLTRRYHTQWA